MISRRLLLRYGLVGAGVLALAGGGFGLSIGLQSTAPREPAQPLRFLSRDQFSVLVAAIEVWCPGAEGLPDGVELRIAEGIDEELSRQHPGLAGEIALLLGLLESGFVGLAVEGRTRPFSQLAPAERLAVLDGWRTSRLQLLRTVHKSLVTLVNAAYWAHPATYAHAGYPGPPNYGAASTPLVAP